MPADGNSAATEGKGDFGTSPIFWQLSDKPWACLYFGKWGAGRKAQYAIENFNARPVGALKVDSLAYAEGGSYERTTRRTPEKGP